MKRSIRLASSLLAVVSMTLLVVSASQLLVVEATAAMVPQNCGTFSYFDATKSYGCSDALACKAPQDFCADPAGANDQAKLTKTCPCTLTP